MPIRNGETLGDYWEWSFHLWQTVKECNIDQSAEQQFYGVE